MTEPAASLSDLNERSRAIFRLLVETYLETGEPVGSRTLSRAAGLGLSPATIRNVMQDLEILGLLGSPHVSAGRVPTDSGLRLFVDGVLEIGDVNSEERAEIERSLGGVPDDLGGMLDRAGVLLSGLSHCASLVTAPKREAPIRHVDFVSLASDRAIAVLVMQDGTVENRIFNPPPGLTPSAMREAANFLNAGLHGHTLGEARKVMEHEIAEHRSELDRLAADLVEKGLAMWDGDAADGPDRLIVRGRANLIEDAVAVDGLERIRRLFDDLEQKKDLMQLIDLAGAGDGVRVFIGSENKLFSLSGSSLVISPYRDADRHIIGAIGVIGPTRLNYGRIVPIVDYTARLIGRLVSGETPRDGGAVAENKA